MSTVQNEPNTRPDQLNLWEPETYVLIESAQVQAVRPLLDPHLAEQRTMNEAAAWADFESAPWDVQEGEWRRWAACVGHASEHDATSGPEALLALRRCADCPVREWCRAWVETEPDYAGVAAGEVHHGRRHRRHGRPAA